MHSARADNPAPWFRRYRPVAAPRVRLICFPPAGAAASFYRSWPDTAPPDLEVVAVQYPGRQDRLGEPAHERMEPLADAVAEALVALADRPLALFGHSMGASVAQEVAARLEGRHGIRPVRLFVSARKPPQRLRPRDIDTDDDDALIKEVERLGSPDAEVLRNPQLRELALPAIRADFRICETYQPASISTLDVPIVFYRSAGDPGTEPDDLGHWVEATRGGAVERVLPGGHFSLLNHEQRVIHDIVRALYAPRPA